MDIEINIENHEHIEIETSWKFTGTSRIQIGELLIENVEPEFLKRLKAETERRLIEIEEI